MVSRNVSEMARIEALLEELHDLREEMKGQWKSSKEKTLRMIREIERQLDLDSVPYNSEKF